MSYESIRMGRKPKKEKESFLNSDSNIEEELKENSFLCEIIDFKNNQVKNSFGFMLGMEQMMLNSIQKKSLVLYEMILDAFNPQFKNVSFLIQNYSDSNTTVTSVNINETFRGIMIDLSCKLSFIIDYMQKLPGLSVLNRQDLQILLRQNIFPVYLTSMSTFFNVKNLYYYLPNGVVLNKKSMRESLGKNTTYSMFMIFKLLSMCQMKQTEMSLFLPYLITKCDDPTCTNLYNNFDLCMQINAVYKKASFREFEFNSRSIEFYKVLSDVRFVTLNPLTRTVY
jgi:hypothetical protein